MIRLILVLAPLLHCEAATVLYHRPGHQVHLPCASDDPVCSNIKWLYNRIQAKTLVEVENGKVRTDSVRAARLDVDTKCSLVIRNITDEDAGSYTCRHSSDLTRDQSVHLSVLTISPSPPDADPKRDGNVILICSLFRYSGLGQCEQNSIRWLDETGAVLQGQGDGFDVLRQFNCVSALSVERQRGPNRRFRCQYVEKDSVKIEADYTPEFTDVSAENIYIYVGVGVGVGVVVLLILTAVLIKRRKRTEVMEDQHQPADASEAQSGVTYSTVSHQKVPAQRQVKDEETVTYSEIRTDTDDDPRHLNGCVIKTQ